MVTLSNCVMCGKPLPSGRRKYCSTKCSNRAAWIAKYGLTPEDYAAMLGDSRCVICGRKMKKVHVDHSHDDGIVRGLVCSLCNRKVLTVINTPIKAFNLLLYLLNNPASLLDGKVRVVGAEIKKRDSKPRRRFYRG